MTKKELQRRYKLWLRKVEANVPDVDAKKYYL
jgi:hypothetical protein